MQTHSLLPLTPDTMRSFRQEILVDLAALTRQSVHRKIAEQMPSKLGKDASFLAAFEALRLFRQITREKTEHYSETEQSQLAEIEVEWCLDLLDQLQRGGKIESE